MRISIERKQPQNPNPKWWKCITPPSKCITLPSLQQWRKIPSQTMVRIATNSGLHEGVKCYWVPNGNRELLCVNKEGSHHTIPIDQVWYVEYTEGE